MLSLFSAVCSTILYVLVVYKTSIFARQDPVSLMRDSVNPCVVAALYIFSGMNISWMILCSFKLQLACAVTPFILMVVVARYAIVNQTNTLVNFMNTQLSVLGWEIPELSMWTILQQPWISSTVLLKLCHNVISFRVFSCPVYSNCCFIFCITHSIAEYIQAYQSSHRKKTRK